MIYLEYEDYKIKYIHSQQRYEQIITEKENLFLKTQPKSVQFDKERVSGGLSDSAFDNYLIAKEQKNIDARLAEAKEILNERENLLRIKEAELRESNEVLDRLYCCRVLDRMKMQKIIRVMNYSESHIYRMLGEIYREVKALRQYTDMLY